MKKLFAFALAVLTFGLVAQSFAGPLVRAPQTFYSIRLDAGTKTAAATSGAATLNKLSGVITTESLSTAAGAVYTLTITDSSVTTTDLVMVSVNNGTNSAGSPAVTTVAPGSGSLVIKVQNIHASAAFNGTLKIAFASLKN